MDQFNQNTTMLPRTDPGQPAPAMAQAQATAMQAPAQQADQAQHLHRLQHPVTTSKSASSFTMIPASGQRISWDASDQ